MIIAAFPGAGKTTIEQQYPDTFKDTPTEDLVELYGWTPLYFEEFADRVAEVVQSGKIAFMLPVTDVMDRLIGLGYQVKCYVPNQSDKEEYMDRYKERGSDESFLKRIDSSWDWWLHQIHTGGYDVTVLKPGQYLSDVIDIGELNNAKQSA